MVKDDILTSIHMEEYETEARETKLGAGGEITADIPNVGEDARDLDDRGIISHRRRGASGDILRARQT